MEGREKEHEILGREVRTILEKLGEGKEYDGTIPKFKNSNKYNKKTYSQNEWINK